MSFFEETSGRFVCILLTEKDGQENVSRWNIEEITPILSLISEMALVQ